MAIRVDEELDVAVGSGAEQETGFLTRGNRVARQRQVEGSVEVLAILDLVGASAIVRELPESPVGEASRLADTRLTESDEPGIVVDAVDRGARNIIERAGRDEGRVDGIYLSIGSVSEADEGCVADAMFYEFHKVVP